MNTRTNAVLTLGVMSLLISLCANAQMGSRSQGKGGTVVPIGSSQAPNLSGATQAQLTFSLAGLSFSGVGAASLPNVGGGSGDGNVTYSSATPSVCSVSGNSVTPITPGTCSISATKAGSGVYGPATAISSVQISPIPQAALLFSLANLSFSNSGTATLPSATGGSGGLSVSYTASGNCTVSGTLLTATGIGNCTVTATNSANGMYSAISQSSSTTIAAQPQSALSFDISNITYSTGSPATATLPSASGGSGNGAITYAASGSCSISGNTLTASGDCTVTATKAANGIYSSISQSSTKVFPVVFSVTAAQTVTSDTGCGVTITGKGGSGSYTGTLDNPATSGLTWGPVSWNNMAAVVSSCSASNLSTGCGILIYGGIITQGTVRVSDGQGHTARVVVSGCVPTITYP